MRWSDLLQHAVLGAALIGAVGASRADAATYNVGTDALDYASVREAIAALNTAGPDMAAGLDEIVIDSAQYVNTADWGFMGAPSACQNLIMPVLTVPATIRSTGGASATAPLPPLASEAALTLEGLTLHGGEGTVVYRYYSDTGCVGGVSTLGDLTGSDLVFEPGEAYGGGSPIVTTMGDVALSSVSVGPDATGAYTDNLIDAQFGGFFSLTDVTLDGTDAAGVAKAWGSYVSLFDVGELTNVTITGARGPGLEVRRGRWTITGGSVAGAQDSGFLLQEAVADISGTLFDGNKGDNGGAIGSWGNGTNLTVGGATFTNNIALGGGGAIAFRNDYPAGVATVFDSTFTNNSADGFGGAIAVQGVLEASGLTIGGLDGSAQLGGAIAVSGRGVINDSAISDVHAFTGGAIYYEAPPDDPGELMLAGVSVDGTGAVVGGAIAVQSGALLQGIDLTITNTFAESMGGAVYLGQSAAQKATAATVGASAYFTGLTIDGATAGMGGAFAMESGGNSLSVDGATITNVAATVPRLGIAFFGGEGGLAWLDDRSWLSFSNTTVVGASADVGGGLLASGDGASSVQFGPVGGLPGQCSPLVNANRRGSTIQLDTVQASDISAPDFAIAGFDGGDSVAIHASDFSAASDFVGDLPTQALIGTANARRFDMTCSSVCGVSGGGAVIAHRDAAGFSSSETIPEISYRNNRFTGAMGQDVIDLDFCSVLSNNQGGLGGPRPQGFFVDTADTSGDTGVLIEPMRRGHVDIAFNTFLDSGATLIGGRTSDVALDISNNLFDGGTTGIDLVESLFVTGDYNLYNGLTADAAQDAAAYFPGANALTTGPTYTSYVPETCDSALWLAEGSAGRDQGDPTLTDWWDGSVADVGAYGGADACFPDGDLDGFVAVLDCNDADRDIFPGANETPYDAIDQDCDTFDWCDVDGDGFDSDHDNCGGPDCDDARADINPDATEIFYDGIDQDCSGNDCDADGDGYASDNATCGGPDCDDELPTVYPGAPEIDGDGVDSNCDGDDDNPPGCDEDGDGVMSEACGGPDCNDADATIFAYAPEVPYDGIDQDCDGADQCDADGDGFDAMVDGCGGDDCDDADATVYPGAGEILGDGIDQDCSGEDDVVWVQGGPSGCNCSSTGGNLPMGVAWLGAFGLLVLRRRRQR